MNTKKSPEKRQVNRPQSNDEPTESMSKEHTGIHYVKHHGYKHGDFADRGEIIQYTGIRVVDKTTSGVWEEFESFRELKQSDWKLNGAGVARLSDGTILYEGSL